MVIRDHQVHPVSVESQDNVVLQDNQDQMVQVDQMVLEAPLDLVEVMVCLYVKYCMY